MAPLKALLTQSGGSARALVLSAGGHFDQLLAEVDRALDGLARVANHDGEVRMSQDLAASSIWLRSSRWLRKTHISLLRPFLL